MFKYLIIIQTLLLAACQLQPTAKQTDDHQGTKLLVLPSDAQALRGLAAERGLQVEGTAVLTISGPAEDLAAFQQEISAELGESFTDHPAVRTQRPAEFGELDQQVLYLAKKDFGLPAYWANNPTHDGRQVIVGVVDDGISPHQSGFQVTTTGERKFIGRHSQSSFLTFQTEPRNRGDAEGFLKTIAEDYTVAYVANHSEERPLISSSWQPSSQMDLNGDGAMTAIAIAVLKNESGYRICVDSNANDTADAGECFGTFKATGEYGYWTADELVTVAGEFNESDLTVTLTEGERSGDSHGEGVASVLAGHNIAGRFDGVAPGAQILDYDLGERTDKPAEELYTISTFLRAFETLAKDGAEVINVSYSLFFASAKAQTFMQKAIAALQAEHGFIVSFSAGNNGPGVGSLNRREIYPHDVLVAGAFVGQELDEYVHGVTGLPEEGRVVYYSSRGPGPAGGRGPVVISPLASLTHADPFGGFTSFSGTSSASPALAGLTTVLISAVKQLELPLDYGAIVHAVRMSGTPLTGVPFVEQGAGLPKMDRALAIYRQLIAGDQYERIDVRITGSAGRGPDGITNDGLVLNASEAEAEVEFRAAFRGILADTVPASRRSEALQTYDLEYSADWLSGPRAIWVAAGNAHMPFFKLDMTAAKASVAPGKTIFGEIRLKSQADGSTVHVLPVTIINPVAIAPAASLSFQGEVAAEEGKAIHLDVPAGLAGMRIQVDVTAGNGDRLGLQMYNPSGVKTVRAWGTSQTEDFFVPLDGPGLYQLGFMRSKGTSVALKFAGTISPIAVEAPDMWQTGLALNVQNLGPALEAKATLVAQPQELMSTIRQISSQSAAEVSVPVTALGSYSFAVEPYGANDISYFYPLCTAVLSDATGETKTVLGGSTVTVRDEVYVGGKIEMSCYSFDVVFGTDPDREEAISVAVKAAFSTPERLRSETEVLRLDDGANELRFEFDPAATVEPGLFQLQLGPVFDGTGVVTLPNIQVVQ